MLQERPPQAACSGQDGEQDRRDNHQENSSHTEPEISSANIVSTHQPLLVVVARNRSVTNTFSDHPDQPSCRHCAGRGAPTAAGQQVPRPPELMTQRLDA
jgi:hypothetical protein